MSTITCVICRRPEVAHTHSGKKYDPTQTNDVGTSKKRLKGATALICSNCLPRLTINLPWDDPPVKLGPIPIMRRIK